jgi:DNA-binding NarL/FixJ family response regulator
VYLEGALNRNSFVGLFGSDDPAKERRDAYLLRRMAAPLNAISRSMSATTSRRGPEVVDGLTARQREVALLIAEGLSNAAIAELLVLREDTVKKYVSGILATLKCQSRTQVALLIKESQSAMPA